MEPAQRPPSPPQPSPSQGRDSDQPPTGLPKLTGQIIIGLKRTQIGWVKADSVCLAELFGETFPGWDEWKEDYAAFEGALLYFPAGVRLSPEKPAVLLIEGEDGQGEEIPFQVRSEIELPKIDPNKQLATFLLAQMSTKELVPVRPIDGKQQRALWPTKAKVSLRC